MNLFDNSYVSFNDILSTVASCLRLNTGSAEREAETAGIDIQNAFFLVFLICRVSDCPVDLTYFNFRSVVSAIRVDIRAPASSFFLEFSLRLPQSLRTSAFSSAVVIKPSPAPVFVKTSIKSIADLSVKLGNISDDLLFAMD